MGVESQDDERSVLAFGPLKADLLGGCVWTHREAVELPPLQLRILGYLILRAGSVVTHEDIRKHVFRVAQRGGGSNIPRQICALRKQLGEYGTVIQTARGGYGVGLSVAAVPDGS